MPRSTPGGGWPTCPSGRSRRARRPTTWLSVLGGALPDTPTDPADGRRPARRGRRAGPDGDAVGPVLRLGDRRHASGGARRRLAGQRVGPERRDALRHTGRRGGRGGRRRLAARPARACRRCRRRVHHRRRRWPASPAWPPARQQVLADAGWDVERLGLAGGPRVTVLVGAERHDSVDLALRYLGLGAPTPVAADDQGRVVPAALADALAAAERADDRGAAGGQPALRRLRPVRASHRAGARARGLGARGRRLRSVGRGLARAAAPRGRRRGRRLVGHRRPQDPQRAVRLRRLRGRAIRSRCRPRWACTTSYLVRASDVADPFDKVPELSRRARGVPVWAALAVAGRSGVADAGRAGWPRTRGPSPTASPTVPGRRGAQRGRVHPGVRLLRRRRAHPGGHRAAARRRHGVDVRFPVARAGRAAGLGEQLVDRSGRRRRLGRRRTPRSACH